MSTINDFIIGLIPIISVVFSAGLVLYADGVIFSGGKGWRKGLKNVFETINKGFLYFLANVVAMVVVGYFLEKLIKGVLITYQTFFLPIILLFLSLLYFYYLKQYTKKGLKRWRVLIISLLIIAIFILFGKYL